MCVCVDARMGNNNKKMCLSQMVRNFILILTTGGDEVFAPSFKFLMSLTLILSFILIFFHSIAPPNLSLSLSLILLLLSSVTWPGVKQAPGESICVHVRLVLSSKYVKDVNSLLSLSPSLCSSII